MTRLSAGIKIKLNAVALKDFNEHEIPELMRFAHARAWISRSLKPCRCEIEEDRTDRYLPLRTFVPRSKSASRSPIFPSRRADPALRRQETGGRLGFITHEHNFCESCNRVRITCTGTLYMCLGQDDAADLRTPLRASDSDALLSQAIDDAILRKPKGHDFIIDRNRKRPAVARHMSVTGADSSASLLFDTLTLNGLNSSAHHATTLGQEE